LVDWLLGLAVVSLVSALKAKIVEEPVEGEK